jgi:plastocyanin
LTVSLGKGNLVRVILALIGVGLLITIGCTGTPVPESSLTGAVSEVRIGDMVLTPKVITVKTRDEVRWVNTRKFPIEIRVEKPVSAGLSCLKGFVFNEGFEFVGSRDPKALIAAKINTDEFASLCFSASGIYNYTVDGTDLEGTVMVK